MSDSASNQGWDIFIKVVAVTIVPWSVWVTVGVFESREFRKVTEANRFTSKDGHALQREVQAQSAAIQKSIYMLEKELSSQFVRTSELEVYMNNREKTNDR